ncbi:hypothetical protein O3G_MSEX012983 [Manduca sexta]|uniref:Ig-like domain-containing protein n=1 Tax=Manduca sexta TaxID=7130 RepID=A0A921ZS87_MANSE|nr:hypothetical protein O3G_MSEX012983 [Manduca sexta]
MLWLLKLSIIAQWVQSVRIVNMRVPEAIQYGTRDKVTLDCEYNTRNVTGLVVKWFYNDRSQQVYQWIPPQKPQALGLLKDKLDLNFKVSNDPYTQQRALRIVQPVPELTGNYTCVVSTFLAEDERTRPMTIFVPEKKFDMVVDRLNNVLLDIICVVEGVYPMPKLAIFIANRPQEANSSIKLEEGRYTAVTSVVVRVEAFPPTAETLCCVHVPLANYHNCTRKIFYRDEPPTPLVHPKSAHTQSVPDRGNGLVHSSYLFLLVIVHLSRIVVT